MIAFVVIGAAIVVLAITVIWCVSGYGRGEPPWWEEFEREFRAYAAQQQGQTGGR